MLKTIVQTLPDNTPAHKMKMGYIARQGYRTFGWSFFVQGLTPTLIRAFPSNAVVFIVYEACLEAMS